MHPLGPEDRSLVVTVFLQHLQQLFRIGIQVGVFRAETVGMDGDHVEFHAEFIAFPQQQVGFGDPAPGVHVGRIALKDLRFGVAFPDTLGKRLVQQCDHVGDILVSGALPPPVVGQFAAQFAAEAPQFDMRVFRGERLACLFHLGQIFRGDRPVGIQMEVADQDVFVVEVLHPVGLVGIEHEEVAHLEAAGPGRVAHVAQHVADIRFHAVFFVFVPDRFRADQDMVFGADSQLPPAFHHQREIETHGRIGVADPVHALVPLEFIQELHMRIAAEIICGTSVAQLVLAFEDKHSEPRQVVQRQRQFGCPAGAGPEVPSAVQQGLAEKVFHRDVRLPRHVGLGGGDAEPAVDLRLRGNEIVRRGSDQPSFRGRGLVCGCSRPLFQLDRVHPDQGVAGAVVTEETERKQRFPFLDRKNRLIPFPLVGELEIPAGGMAVDGPPDRTGMEIRDPDEDP